MDINIICDKCETSNIPKSEICEKCGSPLSIKKAMELDQDKNKEIGELKQQMEHINKVLEALALEKKIKA